MTGLGRAPSFRAGNAFVAERIWLDERPHSFDSASLAAVTSHVNRSQPSCQGTSTSASSAVIHPHLDNCLDDYLDTDLAPHLDPHLKPPLVHLRERASLRRRCRHFTRIALLARIDASLARSCPALSNFMMRQRAPSPTSARAATRSRTSIASARCAGVAAVMRDGAMTARVVRVCHAVAATRFSHERRYSRTR